MPSIAHLITQPMPPIRSFAIATIMGAAILASPLTSARAEKAANGTVTMAQAVPQTKAAEAATSTKAETVEQRITTLHAALKITSDEDVKWTAVAQAMRDNAASMDKLVTESRLTPPQNTSAVDDLKMYQKFSQAHVDGLKNLIASFAVLYSAMPDAQKKIADTVFQAHQNASAHG